MWKLDSDEYYKTYCQCQFSEAHYFSYNNNRMALNEHDETHYSSVAQAVVEYFNSDLSWKEDLMV